MREEPIRVVVHGALGRMGQEVLKALVRDPDCLPVGAVEHESKVRGEKLRLPEGEGEIPLSDDLGALIKETSPHVVVDFSVAEAAVAAAKTSISSGVCFVSGTTGIPEEEINEIERLSREREVGVVIAPNFSIGAVLMMHMAKIAARYFPYAEIIEAHHERKLDAPSGTALATARGMLQAKGSDFSSSPTEKEVLPGCRGGTVGGVGIHSLRLPGVMAYQQVIFGGPGQTLSIAHNVISRESYMPGVLLAVKEVVRRRTFIFGLDKLLGL